LVQTGLKYTALDKNKAIPVYIKSMSGRAEITDFEKHNWGFSFIKTSRFLTCSTHWKNKNWESILENTMKNTLGNWEFRDQNQLGLFLEE